MSGIAEMLDAIAALRADASAKADYYEDLTRQQEARVNAEERDRAAYRGAWRLPCDRCGRKDRGGNAELRSIF